MSEYRPEDNDRPDPGEVCWAWVPYEEDPSQGKDRPVLVIDARVEDDEPVVDCLVLTSKDHDRDAAQEAEADRFWMNIGTGDWDADHRPSEVRLNRLVTLRSADVRREGAALDPDVYAAVIAARSPYA